MKPKLRGIVFEAGWFLWQTTAQLLVVTHVIRTASQHTEIYGQLPEYQEKPWRSPHEFGNALDGTVDATIDTLNSLVHYINKHFIYDAKRLEKKTLLLHEVFKANGESRGQHLHFQVWEG